MSFEPFLQQLGQFPQTMALDHVDYTYKVSDSKPFHPQCTDSQKPSSPDTIQGSKSLPIPSDNNPLESLPNPSYSNGTSDMKDFSQIATDDSSIAENTLVLPSNFDWMDFKTRVLRGLAQMSVDQWETLLSQISSSSAASSDGA